LRINRGSQVVAITAEFLVGSIDGLTSSGHISKEFVGFILLPNVANAAGRTFPSLIMSTFLIAFDGYA